MPEERATIKENRVGVKVYIINKPFRTCQVNTGVGSDMCKKCLLNPAGIFFAAKPQGVPVRFYYEEVKVS